MQGRTHSTHSPFLCPKPLSIWSIIVADYVSAQ
uniref:Uncharacterized protein n=1 Tax=Anguilla anguilla TaxID=7936 RepID=A0A0E9SG18_ANGAN